VKVLRVSQYTPRSVGHGGFHRAYQIQHDLERAVGKENVIALDDPWAYYPPAPKNLVTRAIHKGTEALARYLENPYNLLARTTFTPKAFSFPALLQAYEEAISQIDRPAVCIIEHPGFADVVALNARYHIPTVCCTQNLEAFDTATPERQRKRELYAAAIDFANELGVFAQCAERLFISKTEAGVVGGLGLSARYYPYRPVGAVRERLAWIRRQRDIGLCEPDLFLIVGTAGHETTRASLRWFIQNTLNSGLPAGSRVVVIGLDTEKLLPSGRSVPGLELRGWVEQAELDRLLVRASAVLIPQRSGFGALTRLSELACAGVPVIVSRHATYAIDPPPGLDVVDDDWDAWCAAIAARRQETSSVAEEAYAKWEEMQPETLHAVVCSLLGGGAAQSAESGARPRAGLLDSPEPVADLTAHVARPDGTQAYRAELVRLTTERENLAAQCDVARQAFNDITRSRTYRLLRRLGRWRWFESRLSQFGYLQSVQTQDAQATSALEPDLTEVPTSGAAGGEPTTSNSYHHE